MKHNGHTFIDILKLDIEGGEYDALQSFIAAHAHEDLPLGQIQIEIHAREGRERFDTFLQWWESLEGAGLRPFWTEPNLVYINVLRGVRPELAEYSFINIHIFTATTRSSMKISIKRIHTRVFGKPISPNFRPIGKTRFERFGSSTRLKIQSRMLKIYSDNDYVTHIYPLCID